MKRYLLLFLVAVNALFATAQFSGSGSGTSSDPYLIFNPMQLVQMSNFLNREGIIFELKNDIDLTEFIADNYPNEGWAPIGTSSTAFKGTLKGNGYSIKGLSINRPSTTHVGLFGHITGATITNLKIEASQIKGGNYTGTFCGLADSNSNISQITVNANEVVGSGNTGGLIGKMSGTAKTITVNISSQVYGTSSTGGIFGAFIGTATSLNVQAKVTSSGKSVGGAMGASNATVTTLNQKGDVSGAGSVGGISGEVSGTPSFSNCKSFGNITSTNEGTGGIIGSGKSKTLTNCSHQGKVNGTNYVGGVYGYGDFESMTSCSHFGDVTGANYVGGVYGGNNPQDPEYPVYYTSNSSTTNSKVSTWTNTSKFEKNNISYVMSKCSAVGNISGNTNVGGLIGSHKPTVSFRFKSYTDDTGSGQFVNSGYYYYIWRGNECVNPTLIARFISAPVTDVATDYIDYSTLNIANSYYCGNVNGVENVGGLVGLKVSGTLEKSYANASVFGDKNVGGLAGSITGSTFGGVGILTIRSSAAINTVVSASKENVGRIYGKKTDSNVTIGELGTAQGNLSVNKTNVVKSGIIQTITDDLQNGSSTGPSMLKLKATFVAKGWNFDNDWTIQETESYPYMRYQAAPPVIESKLVSGATSISGKSINGGTVYMRYMDNAWQTYKCGSDNNWQFTTGALQSGAEIITYAEKDGLTPSYFTTSLVNFPGSGTEADPYLIYSAADLQSVSKGGCYKIMNDIDLTNWINTYSSSKGWVSVGRSGVESISIDGGNHKITGLWINTNEDYTGLFSNLTNSTIKNLVVEVVNGKQVKGANYTGVLVGRSANGSILNVIVKGNVNGTVYVGGVIGNSEGNTINDVKYIGQISSTTVNAHIGGIAGHAVNNTITSSSADATINVTGSGSFVGGIAGYASGRIEKVSSHASISSTGTGCRVGGLLGSGSAKVNKCLANGSVSATGANSYSGGLIGYTEGGITDCYSTATVHGTQYSGGLVAFSQSSIDRCYASGNVSGVLNGAGLVAQLSGSSAKAQHSAAFNNQLTFTDQSSWASRVIGGYKNGAADPDNSNYALKTMQVSLNGVPTKKYDDIVEGIAKEESVLKTAAFYTGIGWDMTDVWTINEGTGYPTLAWETPDAPTPATYTITATADATMGTVTGAGEYTEGDEVTLTATAAEGYEFVSWSDGTTENPYVFTASEDKTLTATFKKKETPVGPEPDPDSSVLPSTDVSTLPYALYFNDEESRAGDFPLELNMKNAEENITAFQCDVYLPEGIVWKSTTDKRGKVTYNAPTFNEDRTDLSYHTIAPMAKNADGSYNIIVYSMDKETILETDGALLTLPLEIPEDMPTGDYNIIVRNIVMTNVNTEQTKVDEVVSRLTIPSYTIGDANGDDEINVTDIVYIISYIREEVPEGFVAAAADVNADNEVNVTDIVGVIDLIRDPGAGASTRAMHVKKAAPSATCNLDVLPFTLTQGTTTANVQLNMNNPGDEFTAFQCDIQLPEGINWAYTVDKRGNKKYTQPTFNAEADRTDATYHTVSAGINQGDGSMNIIVYSMEKETFLDEEGAILDMPFMFDANLAPGIYDVVVKNVVMTRPNNTQIKPADYTFSIMVGSPATEVAALKGRYDVEVLSEFSTALSANASICAVDMTTADVDAASATLSLGNENALIYLAEGSAIANTKNVVVDGECANLVLTDSYAFHAPMPFEATEASYSRSVATDGWYSIVLPFAAEIPSGVSVEKFQSLDEAGSVATFTQVMTMEGDVPYIYHASAGNTGFTAQNVEIAATPSEIADGAFKGTYSTLEAGSVTGSYALRGDGTGFGVCDATAYVPAFRAYLQAGGGASNVRIYHDGLTGIHTATSANSDAMYDLCGRRVNKEAKGVVLMNRNKQIRK